MPARFQVIAGRIGIAVFFLGFFALIGWLTQIDVFKEGVPGFTAMKPNSALCLVCLGISLSAQSLNPAQNILLYSARLCAGLAAAIALLSFSESLFRIDLAIEQLFFRDFNGLSDGSSLISSPGRMPPAVAFAVFLAGGSLFFLDSGSAIIRFFVQVFSVICSVIGLLVLLGYIYGIKDLFEVAAFSSIALPAAVALFILGVGTLAARPDRCYLTDSSSQTAIAV